MLPRQSCRYCETGRELWVQDKVAFVLSISDRETRMAVMDTLRDNAPQWAEEIEGRIIRTWTEQRGKQDENRQTANS